MKKALSIILSVFILFSFVTACKNNDENTGSSQWAVENKNFSGRKDKTIKLDSTENYNLVVSAETKEGELKLVIKDENDNIYYTDEKVDTGEYIVLLKQYKKYTLYLEGKDHTGTFNARWESSEPEAVTKDESPIVLQ